MPIFLFRSASIRSSTTSANRRMQLRGRIDECEEGEHAEDYDRAGEHELVRNLNVMHFIFF